MDGARRGVLHLMPKAAPLDSLAENAFERARQLDPEFAPALFHLGQLALRRRDLRRAGEFIRRFRELSPDTILSAPLGLVFSCIDRGPGVFTSPDAKTISASALTIAGKWLASAVEQWPCAQAAFTRVLRTDSASLQDRWGALLGLSSLLVASGHAEQVHQLFRAPGAQGLPGSFLYLLDATVDTVLSPQADSAARAKGKELSRDDCADAVAARDLGDPPTGPGRPPGDQGRVGREGGFYPVTSGLASGPGGRRSTQATRA